jgi:F-type H+-transporting ATPase subunit epsilon
MADTIQLDMVTPERRLISTEVEDLVGKAVEGEFGILPGHANYVTLLEAGELSFIEGGERRHVAVTGGFAEVSLEHGIRIMAESAEFAEEIDLDRARSAKDRAERRISDYDPESQEIDIVRAQAALTRALTRIEVARRLD